MNKTNQWTAVLAIMNKDTGISDDTKMALELLLAPKSGGGTSVNPPILDESGNIVEAWCRYHERYELADDMVIMNNKSKGYCKAASSISNKRRAEHKSLMTQALDAMGVHDEEAMRLRDEAKIIQPTITGIEHFDYDQDWADFNEKPEAKETK